MSAEAKAKIDSSFLVKYKEDLDEVFRAYIEDINPFIVQFEVLKNEFPIELQNEIRAIYGHLARASIAETPEVAERNIQKIKSHTKRALLDCYKYSCIILTDNYVSFFDRYKGVDLSYLEKGTFLTSVQSLYNEAKDHYFKAKKAETSNISEEQQFELYQDAYNLFTDLQRKIETVEEDAAFLKHKATRKDYVARISLVVGILGAVVGIVGLAVALF